VRSGLLLGLSAFRSGTYRGQTRFMHAQRALVNG
jgi:hypothetical protein